MAGSELQHSSRLSRTFIQIVAHIHPDCRAARYAYQKASWLVPAEIDLFRAIASYCGAQSGGPLGAANLVLTDDNGDEHLFAFETFFTRHRPPSPGKALTLGIYSRPHARAIAV